ncbi:MAG: molybdopterin-binding protein [Lachnospiraceae bacterium]|nr:molybdopterin-binding protein [Lachnospiraceae bacterium]
MKKTNIEDAVGMTLCHDVTAMYPGFKGPLFKRGHVIEEKDISAFLDIGKKSVYTGDIPKDMLHEEDCAVRLAQMAAVSGAHYEGPSEGKVVLVSDIDGMLKVNTGLLRSINSIGDITVTTLPDHYRVRKGMKIASMRIVPLFTKKEVIDRAEELCKGSKLIDILPYKSRKAGIIITGSEVYNGRIEERFEKVITGKLDAYPGIIAGVRICDDDTDMIVGSARKLLDLGADFLIFTGGMSVDPDDLTPGAIKRLGAEIVSYGLPAQPGNMTLVAYLNDTVIAGVPGAAISRPVTMFDVLLPQIYAGIKFTKTDLINLAEGGLCQMCEDCHYPNCTFGRY